MKKCLTIAGSDSGGGAGIQADLKTFSAHGTFGMSVITAVTAQNTQGVFDVQDISSTMITHQIEAIFDDIEPDVIKIGMVSNAKIVEAITKTLKKYKLPPIVVDPVMISKSGSTLLQSNAKKALIEVLIPMATIITPNLLEAEAITGYKITTVEAMKEAASFLHGLGCSYVLIKGGQHIKDAIDVLYDGKEFYIIKTQSIDTKNTHGTGCTLSSAIAANLSKGIEMKSAVSMAKTYITEAIKQGFAIGHGVGPVHHFHHFYNNRGEI